MDAEIAFKRIGIPDIQLAKSKSIKISLMID